LERPAAAAAARVPGAGVGTRPRRRRRRGDRDTRLDAATTAGCHRAAWVVGCRRGGRGRGVGEGGCRKVSVRPGKGCCAEHICCSPRCRFGSGKISEAAELELELIQPHMRRENHQEGKDGERGVFAWWCRVQERGALRRHRIDRKMVFSRWRRILGWRGAGEDWGGSEPVVASIGLTAGKGEVAPIGLTQPQPPPNQLPPPQPRQEQPTVSAAAAMAGAATNFRRRNHGRSSHKFPPPQPRQEQPPAFAAAATAGAATSFRRSSHGRSSSRLPECDPIFAKTALVFCRRQGL